MAKVMDNPTKREEKAFLRMANAMVDCAWVERNIIMTRQAAQEFLDKWTDLGWLD